MQIKTKEQLRKLYDKPGGRAVIKEMSALNFHAKNFISKSPFLVMGTVCGGGKMDSSPRGGTPGFVYVKDDKTLVIPDSKGNNRLDSLENIIETGTIGLLFLIPGIDETLRVNGSAFLSNDSDLLDLFKNEKKPPQTCIVIKVQVAFLHCAKAMMRSKLWNNDYRLERKDFPTMGQMLKDQLQTPGEIETQEEMVKRYQKDL